MCATKFFSSNFANENYKWIFKTHQNQVFTSYIWYSTTPSEVSKSFYFILNEKYGLFLKFWVPFQPSTTKTRNLQKSRREVICSGLSLHPDLPPQFISNDHCPEVIFNSRPSWPSTSVHFKQAVVKNKKHMESSNGLPLFRYETTLKIFGQKGVPKIGPKFSIRMPPTEIMFIDNKTKNWSFSRIAFGTPT